MSEKATRLSFQGQVERRHEASPKLSQSGAAVLVMRGVQRSLAIKCPDGCGEELTINLDSRTGPAWRYYATPTGISLFPSVWRENGCKSHFIVWNGRIYWCDMHDPLASVSEELIDRVAAALPPTFKFYSEIAKAIDEVPWAVLSALNELCRRGVALAGGPQQRSQFRRAQPKG